MDHASRSLIPFTVAITGLLACGPTRSPAAGGRETLRENPRSTPALTIDLSTDSGLTALGRAIGSRRVVLLGENGHGVAQSTTLKARLVRYLHGSLGFQVVALESGFFECSAVDDSIGSLAPALAARRCLGYPFEHREILPLFEYLTDSAGSPTRLRLSGIDLQIQGNDSRGRTARLRDDLRQQAPGLADSIGVIDSLLLVRVAGDPAILRDWLRADGQDVRRQYLAAARTTHGTPHWTLRTTVALLDRLLLRDTLPAGSQQAPAAFWQRRDEWMAETILWLADSTRSAGKVIVWLHNDHARYGSWMTPSGPARAAGGLLRERLPHQVFSIGFFMGAGSVASNSRQIRQIPSGSAGLETMLGALLPGLAQGGLIFPSAPSGGAEGFGQVTPYLRNGLALDSLIPNREFDALVYLPRVTPPAYLD